MTFRTFTLKDFFDRDAAMAKMQAEQRRPLASGDLAGAGLQFIPMPDAAPQGTETVARDDSRTVEPESHQNEEQLRLAREWAARQS